MHISKNRKTWAGLGGGLSAVLLLGSLTTSGASSHREAPLITEDPVADNTDVYAFVSDDAPDHVNLISNWIPFEEPAGGPNFYNFGRDVLYEIEVDNNGDAQEDFEFEFRFKTVIKNDQTFLYNTGPISFADGEYKNLNVQQMYSVTLEQDGRKTVLAEDLLVPPNNVGPRSTPNYEQLAAAAIHQIDTPAGPMKVFAGQRDDAFPVDLGSIFDLGGLRPFNPAHLVPLQQAEGVNTTTGFNVHSIAVQVPKALLVEDDPVIGVYSTTYRRQTRVFPDARDKDPMHSGRWVQISRLGNPLVNEVVIPLEDKDLFNAVDPSKDAMFLEYVQNPILAGLLPVLYPDVFECLPAVPRDDLVTIFLTGIPGLNQPANVVPSEQLRLNTDIAPTPVAEQDPMGLLAGQQDGWPNGRRIRDDVVDIALRAIAGATPLGDCDGVAPNNALGDGVSGNDREFLDSFPYLATPHPGYSHDHDHSQQAPIAPPASNPAPSNPAPSDPDQGPDSMSRADQITRLYRAFFLRDPDSGGFDHWMNSGLPIEDISQEFANSEEFRLRYGQLTTVEFVELVYRNVLGREGEPAGVQHWVDMINSGSSRGSVMLGFANSAEFRSKV